MCVAEINALRTEIFEYETKGHESTKDRPMSSSLGNSANSSSFEVFNRSASTSSINRDVPSESGGADSAHGNGSNLHLSCWSRCSFTHQGLLKLRRDILLTTANELKISLDVSCMILQFGPSYCQIFILIALRSTLVIIAAKL